MTQKMQRLLQTPPHGNLASAALLLLRLTMGMAFLFHGWGKIQAPFDWMPPGSPVPSIFQFLAALSEFGGGIALILGLLIPLAMLGLGITMAVAVFFHAVVFGDPFVATGAGMSSFEPALGYLVLSLLVLALGPGKFSLDHKIFGNQK